MKPHRILLPLLPVALAVALMTTTQTAASDEDSLPKDVPSLVKLLGDKNPTLRGSAAHRLGELRGKAAAAVPALITLLDDDGVWNPMPIMGHDRCEVWQDASYALQRIGRPAVPALMKATGHSDGRIRSRAAWALGEMRSPPKDVVPAMLCLLGDPDSSVRTSAIHALGRIGRDAAIAAAPLVRLLKNDSDERVRQEVFASLPTVDSDGKLAVPACIQSLKDKSPSICGLAAETLGSYGPRAKSAVPALITMLSGNGSRWLSPAPDVAMPRPLSLDAIIALEQIGPDAASALPELRKMLESEEETGTRAALAAAILRIDPQDKNALPVLLAMLGEDKKEAGESVNPPVALEAMERIGPAAVNALPAVKRALHHEEPEVRGAAALALAGIARKEAVPLLIEQLEVERRRGEAICVRDREEKYPNEVSGLLHEIVEALGKFGADASPAVPVLAEVVADPRLYPFEKEGAIESLGNMGAAARDALPQLIKMLDCDDSDERLKTIVALGRIGPSAKAAAPRLLKIVNSDPDEDIREAARSALQQITPTSSMSTGTHTNANGSR
jgi:HEAT repeat protein